MLSTMQHGQLGVAQLLRYGTTVHGDGEVVTWTGAEPRRHTYTELGRDAARLAHGLRAIGVTGDIRVATFMWNNYEHLTAYLAVPAMGAVLHTLNIRLFPDQLVYIVNHAEDRVVLADASLLSALIPLLPKMPTIEHVVVSGDADAIEVPSGVTLHPYDRLLSGQPHEFDWPNVDETSTAAMCYTSGTTGDPKGVAYSHRSIWLHSMGTCMTDNLAVAQSDRILPVVPMFHAMSWGLPYGALMVGASLVLPDRFLQPHAIAAMLAAERPTKVAAVPTILQGLLQHLSEHPQDVSHLQEAIVGGSSCPPALMEAFKQTCRVQLLPAWGMTETSPVGTIARPPAGTPDPLRYLHTQGRFPAWVQARLVDREGNELPWDDRAVGELEVSGPWVTGPYYSPEPANTVDADHFHDGWLRTGDVGRISADGFLTLTDRYKDIIKSGGEWISSIDIENLVMTHPDVAEAAVIAIPDTKWQERPLAVVVMKAGHHTTADDLRAFLSDKLARWQLPENWAFVDEIPKTSVGKLDKKRLRAAHAAGSLGAQR
jgi:fatty-acyl-CoA synthase